MIRKYLAGALLLAPGLALAQEPTAHPYLVKGKIGQFNAPAKVYLVTGLECIDSATVQQGRFVLKGTTPFPSTATLVLERQGRLQSGWREMMLGGKMRRVYFESPDRLRLFLEPGPVVVTGPDSMRTARVAGGAPTADYQRLDEALKGVWVKRPVAKTKEEYEALKDQFDAVNKAYVQTQLAFVKAHPTSWVSLEVLGQSRQMGLPSYAEVAPLYAALTPAQRTSPPGQQYGEFLAGLKATALGGPAPAFTLRTPSGQAVSLADYRGKYVLVDFWASWCSPCRADNPAILKAYEAYKGRNFEVLGVSLDEEKGRAKWVKAIADDHMPWTQVADLHGFDGPTANQYGVVGIPQNFLVDPNGNIVASNMRGNELEATLAKFIK